MSGAPEGGPGPRRERAVGGQAGGEGKLSSSGPGARPDEAPAPGPATGAAAGCPIVCEICGSEMFASHCKILCPTCGYMRDCSDP